MSDILDLISKIGKKESTLSKSVFISPIFSDCPVTTRVDGIVYTFSISSKKKPGWYRIKPVNVKRARVVGTADLAEIESYLKLLGKIRLVLMMKKDGVYLAVPDKANKYGIPVQNPVPVFLTDDTVMDFDRILARYDGANFWFESLDGVNDPIKSDYLRTSLEKLSDPAKIRISGLTFEEKLAYSLRITLDKKLVEDRKKKDIEDHVAHAGGKLVRFLEKRDHISVTYTVEGEQFTSHVSKDPSHQVIAAGICLQGNDRMFDLKSLITVVREARRRHVVHHFNIDDPGFRDPYERY